MEISPTCALCGAKGRDSSLLAGANGFVCFGCLGRVFERVANTYGKPRDAVVAISTPTAAKRCFICDTPITSGKLVAFREPFCFCGGCLVRAFEIATEDGPEPLAVVNF